MRNGLDISGASELAREIGIKPEEAVIDFRTKTALGITGAHVNICTAHHGTQRMARAFHLPFAEDSSGPGSDFTAYEAAVAALGACVLITHVHGYSARGMTIASLKLTVTAAVEDEGAALHDVQYLIEVDTDGPTESVSEVSQFVTCFSPNHRAFLDEGTFGLAIAVSGAAPDPIEIVWADEQTAGVRGTRRLVKAELVWEYGTETHITTMITPGGDKRLKMPTVIVDQSKQMLGIDRGPNPQELLLAAVSADLTHRIVSIAALRGMPVPNVTVEGSGRLDIRGMLNVSPDIPARFHNVEFVVRTDAGPDVSILADVVREAAEKNVILTALRRPNTVTVDVHTPSGRAISFESNAAQVAGCLEEIAQKPVVAAASDALDG